jgi:hypothetical protein
MEHEAFAEVVAMSLESARTFFGAANVRRVEDAGPADQDRYREGARLYRVYLRP